MNLNISIIAGYDVLADQISSHISYVMGAISRSLELDTDVIIFLGGATNPDYLNLTEARANFNILEKAPGFSFEIWEAREGEDVFSLFSSAKRTNRARATKMLGESSMILPAKVLSVGNTSTETLEAAKKFLGENKIPVGRLILCAEQSRITGFMVDALFVGLLDVPEEVFCYGHPFPESKQGFDSQREKILSKVLSHRSKLFRHIREISQKIHQHKVARLKREQK